MSERLHSYKWYLRGSVYQEDDVVLPNGISSVKYRIFQDTGVHKEEFIEGTAHESCVAIVPYKGEP